MTLDTWLKQQGLLQKVFAERLEVSVATISMLRNGRRKPSPALALRIEKLTKNKVKVEDWDYKERNGATKVAAE